MTNDKQIALRFQERDRSILHMIYNHDGVVARRHIKYLFWRDKSWRAMERRLSLLKRNEYINWPDHKQRRMHPIPEPIIWLGWKGALVLASEVGIEIDVPKKTTEYQLRKVARLLRERGFHWLREPRWIHLNHDITVTDVRFWVTESLKKALNLKLEEWVSESAFRIDTDSVTFQIESKRDGIWREKSRGVIPDGYFEITDNARAEKGESHTARFLLEVDMASHSNTNFGIEKVVPGTAYIKSPKFYSRFGSNVATWLVVTTGNTRMRNLIKQTNDRIREEGRLFYFTTLDQMPKGNLFCDPIWINARSNRRVALVQ
jgi:hypothetical protein